jgi:hypothetical protein
MRTKAITLVCATVIGLATMAPSSVSAGQDPVVVALDALVARPACFAATVAGCAIFVVCLPVAAISKSIKPTAQALVVTPGEATFTRALGDFNYYDDEPAATAMVAPH